MGATLVPSHLQKKYEIEEWRHALAILAGDFPDQFKDILDVLKDFRLRKSHVCLPGGGKSAVSAYFNNAFLQRGWVEKKFDINIQLDQNKPLDLPTHKIDCFKNKIALEIEWSNKDPFYDRDLNNFRLLWEMRAVSAGVIITKSNLLIPKMKELKIFKKYGMTTTWMSKLLPRINGWGNGGCPVVVFAIKPETYVEDIGDEKLAELLAAMGAIKTELPSKRRPLARKIITEALAKPTLPRDLVAQVHKAIEQAKAADKAAVEAAAAEAAEEGDDETDD